MPSLVVFGRSWEFGSDDLVFPFSFAVALRAFWLFVMVVLLVVFRHDLTCPDVHNLVLLAYNVLCLFVAIILLEGCTAAVSARGTIADCSPRWPIPYMLYLRCLLCVGEVTVLVLAITFAFTDPAVSSCTNYKRSVMVLRVMLSGQLMLLLLAAIAVLFYVDPCHCYRMKLPHSTRTRDSLLVVDDDDDDEVMAATGEEEYRLVWEQRCHLIFCCTAGRDDAHRGAYREVSRLFGHFFGRLNLVPSDIAAGLVLLQRRQLSEEEAHDQMSTEEGVCGRELDMDIEQDHYQRILHYCCYAMATYTWPLLLYTRPTSALCQLGRHSRPYTPNGRDWQQLDDHIQHDNYCFCNYRGLLAMGGLDEDQVIYCSFRNDLCCIPFFVALDHSQEAVVIALRGTLSFHDIVTDLLAVEEEIELAVNADHSMAAHKGILRTARWVQDTLAEEGILEDAFSRAPHYQLVLVGHSLGGGCAALLAMLLREQYPLLHCYSYSPPGSLLNEPAAVYSQEFTTSVTLGKDFVGRFTMRSSHALKCEVLSLLQHCQKPKYRLLCEGFVETMARCIGRKVIFDTGVSGVHSPLMCAAPSPILRPLYPPGRILHIKPTNHPRTCMCGARQWGAQWVDHYSFSQIEVGPEMIRDHFPDVLHNALQALWSQRDTHV